MQAAIRWTGGAALGIAVTCLLGVAAQSHFALETLGPSIGPITVQDRLTMIGADLTGFGPRYAMLVGGASVVTYAAAALIARFAPSVRVLVGITAGVVGVLAVVLGLEAAFGQPVLKGAANPIGLGAQALAGGVGGLLFALISAPKRG
jgi:hypothetical protein